MKRKEGNRKQLVKKFKVPMKCFMLWRSFPLKTGSEGETSHRYWLVFTEAGTEYGTKVVFVPGLAPDIPWLHNDRLQVTLATKLLASVYQDLSIVTGLHHSHRLHRPRTGGVQGEAAIVSSYSGQAADFEAKNDFNICGTHKSGRRWRCDVSLNKNVSQEEAKIKSKSSLSDLPDKWHFPPLRKKYLTLPHRWPSRCPI